MSSDRTSHSLIRHILRRIMLLFLILAGNIFADEEQPAIGSAINTLPLFDAHIHYKEPAWESFPVTTVLRLMDRAGVAMALVSSTPDEGTIRLWEYAPNRIVPELRPYHGEFGSANWTRAPNMVEYLQRRMERYPHQGIGEFHLHTIDLADRDFLKQITTLAKKHQALIHLHSDAAPVKRLYELEPELTILWAHAGMTEEPHVIAAMMARYPTLYADTSYRESDILDGGIEGIDSDWWDLIMAFPDRFMIGSDTWINGQWEVYEEIIATNRRWLSDFPREVAEKIAFKNAERLFKRPVTTQLIGTR